MKRVAKFLINSSLFVGAALIVLPALANSTSTTRINFGGGSFVSTEDALLLDRHVFHIGTYTIAGWNPLPESTDGNSNAKTPASFLLHQITGAAFGLTPYLETSAHFTRLTLQNNNLEPGYFQLAQSGLEEAELKAKLRIYNGHFQAALVTGVAVDLTRNNPFSGIDPGPSWSIGFALHKSVGNAAFAFNLGYLVRDPGDPIANSPYQPLTNEVKASLGSSYFFVSTGFTLALEFATHESKKNLVSQERSQALESFLSVSKTFGPFKATLGAGRSLERTLFTPETRILGGLVLSTDFFKAPEELRPSSPTQPVETVRVDIPAPPPAPETKLSQTTIVTGFLPKAIEELKPIAFEEISARYEFSLRRSLTDADLQKEKPPFEVVRLEGLDFPFGSSAIEERHHATLQRLITYLNGVPKTLKIRVEGHTDSQGSEARNQKRSNERAKSVANYLKLHGLDSSVEIDSIGFGSAKPIADNSLNEGRAQNRRVEVRILRMTKAPKEEVHIQDSSPR